MTATTTSSKALAVPDPDTQPPNPYGFTTRTQVRGYLQAHWSTFAPGDGPQHGAQAPEVLAVERWGR